MSADLVTAIATVAAAVVSVVAVAAAFRAASAAEKSAEAAVSALHRGAVRELVGLCHDVLAEDMRIHLAATNLRSDYTTLAVFSGVSGGGQETKLKAGLDGHIAAAKEVAAEAHSLVDDYSKFSQASAPDLDQMSARLSAARMKLRAIRESLEDNLTECRTMNQAYREKKL
jgi:hypothetical protein